jgi:hypothetical protein
MAFATERMKERVFEMADELSFVITPGQWGHYTLEKHGLIIKRHGINKVYQYLYNHKRNLVR